MDWKSLSFDWNRARAFLVTAEEGSLSAAARELRQSQPTLSRQVSALEQELGVALFERGPGGLELTPSGLALLDLAKQMGESANRFSLAASGHSQSIEGNVCISATELTAAYVLPPPVHKLREIEPGIEIEVVASQRASDLKRREADIAVRAFRPTQPYLIGRRIGASHHYLYASKSYLSTFGWPSTVEDLSAATFLGFDRTEALIDVYRTVGLELTHEHFPIIVHDQLVQWSMARAGLGVALMVKDVALRTPDMVQLCPDSIAPLVTENWLVTHRELHTSRRVRFVYDFLFEQLTTDATNK